jgi:dienelactone hydrolase
MGIKTVFRGMFYSVFLSVFAGWAWSQDFSTPGPYAAGWREVTVARPNNSTFQALLYYPAQTATQDAEIDSQASPCPGISFGHGFQVNPDKYRSTFAHLASWGYAVIASRSGGELFPSHQNFANDLSYCLTWLIEQSENPVSFLHQCIDSNALGLSGHSMGGGASILAAAADNRVKAVANLAAADTNPSAVTAMESVAVPISLISGSDDTIVPVGSHGQLMYNNGSAPKQLPVIQGGYHCGFMDSNILFCDSGSISRSQQLAITRHLLTAFFELHLKQDDSVWSWVWGPAMQNDTRWSVQMDACIPGDFDSDCCVTVTDLQAFMMNWQQNSCSLPDWCAGRDFDQNGRVDLADFAIISQG